MSKHCHALLFFVDPTAANSWQVMDPSEDYFDDDCELFDSDSDVSVIRTVEPRPEPDGNGLWSLYDRYLPSVEEFAAEEILDDDEEDFDKFTLITRRDEQEGLLDTDEQPDKKPAAAQKNLMGTAKTYLTLFKSFVGSGVLFLPRGFANGGLLASSIGIAAIAALATYCMTLLLECKKELADMSIAKKRGVRNTNLPVSYGFVGRVAAGRQGRWLVDMSIIVSQLGFCTGYLIFMSKNIHEVILASGTTFDHGKVIECGCDFNRNYIILIGIVVMIPLCLVRQLKFFAITNLVADVFILAGLGYVYFDSSRHIFENGIADIEMVNWQNYGIFLGISVATFEGIALILPIHQSMQKKDTLPFILVTCLGFITLLLISFAAINYMAYGADTQTIILLNLPPGDLRVMILQVCYSVAILLTYPIQFFPAAVIAEHYLFRHCSHRRILENLFRVVACLITAGVAIGGSDSFENFLALVGGIACVPLAFVYPSYFHINILANRRGMFKLYMNYVILIIGILSMFLATGVAVYNWINAEAGPPGFCGGD